MVVNLSRRRQKRRKKMHEEREIISPEIATKTLLKRRKLLLSIQSTFLYVAST
jgi:hypothetical protein